MRALKTPISLGISAQFDQSSLSTSRNLGSLATHCAHRQTGWMHSWSQSLLDTQVILLVLSLYGFYSVLTHIKYRFFGSNDMYNVQLFRLNWEELMTMKKQRQWSGKHNAKKIKRDRYYELHIIDFPVQLAAWHWNEHNFMHSVNGYWLNPAMYFVSGQ